MTPENRIPVDAVEWPAVNGWKKIAGNFSNRDGFEGRNRDIAKGKRPTNNERFRGIVSLVGISHFTT